MHEHHHLQVMIEHMQRAGYSERSIHEAVRQARREDRGAPERRPRRLSLFRRGSRRR